MMKITLKKTLFFSIFLGPLYISSLSLALGIVNTSERRVREHFEDLVLKGQISGRFMGGFGSFHENRLYLTDSQTQEQAWLKEYQFNKKPKLLVHLHHASNYEDAIREFSTGTDRYPVYRQSFLPGNQGLPLSRGENTWVGMEANIPYRDWLFIRSHLESGLSFEKQNPWLHWRQLYLELRWKSFLLNVGRKPIYWGQSFSGPLFIADNATNFDMIEVSTLPIRLPGFFSSLGHFKSDVFLSRMDADRTPPNDYHLGWRFSWLPRDFFEANAGMIFQFSGDGVPGGSVRDKFFEFLGARVEKGTRPNGLMELSDLTNRVAAFDIRFNINQTPWPFSIYTEQHLEDCCGPVSTVIRKGYNYLYGIVFKTGKTARPWTFRIEYAKSGFALYRHSRWPSALSNNGQLMGHPMGRDAQGLYFWASKSFYRWPISLRHLISWEDRIRTEKLPWVGNKFRHVTFDNPNFETSEQRLRDSVWVDYWHKKNWRFSGAIGGIYVYNKSFIRKRDDFEWFSAFQVSKGF